MAHFAKINESNEVLTVLTVDNKSILNSDGEESETQGQHYLEKHNNWPSNLWIQTSYNTIAGKHYKPNSKELSDDQSKTLRGHFAGIGNIWDAAKQLFYKPQPYPSWTLNTTTAQWEPPTPMPDLAEGEKGVYTWNEKNQSWDKEVYL